MDDIKGLTAKQAREKLADRQEKLGKVFEEAKVTGDSGEKQYDFNRVTILGADVKGSIAVAEKVHAMNLEANELAKHAETLEAAEKAANDHADREKGVRGFAFAGGGKGREDAHQAKSLGQLVREEKGFQSWAKGGAGGGIKLNFDEAYPSDILAKGANFETMRTKALMSTSAGWAPESIRAPGFVEMATRPIQVLDIFPMFKTGQAAYTYMEETTRNHNAAEKAEGATFAESEFAFTEKTSPVKKITDSLPVTDEQLEDVEGVESYINGRLVFGLRRRLDGQCIVGDATGANLRGLKNVAGINTQAKGADPAMDAFYKGMTAVRLTGRALPTHHLMHPEDWQGIRLTRTADGIYIFGAPTEAGPERLWGLPVVQQDADVQGRGYTGSFTPECTSLFEKKGVDIELGYVGTQFAEGKRTVRGDCRFALVFFRPAAFTEITGL